MQKLTRQLIENIVQRLSRVNPSPHQDSHLLFFWPDSSSVNTPVQYSKKSHSFLNCVITTFSFASELEVYIFFSFFFYQWAWRHCSLECFEKEDWIISNCNDFVENHFPTKCPSTFTVSGASPVMYYKYRQVCFMFDSSLKIPISWSQIAIQQSWISAGTCRQTFFHPIVL